jgi:hypothetical protein
VVLSEVSFFRKYGGFEMSGKFSRLEGHHRAAETFLLEGDDSLSRTGVTECDPLASSMDLAT